MKQRILVLLLLAAQSGWCTLVRNKATDLADPASYNNDTVPNTTPNTTTGEPIEFAGGWVNGTDNPYLSADVSAKFFFMNSDSTGTSHPVINLNEKTLTLTYTYSGDSASHFLRLSGGGFTNGTIVVYHPFEVKTSSGPFFLKDVEMFYPINNTRDHGIWYKEGCGLWFENALISNYVVRATADVLAATNSHFLSAAVTLNKDYAILDAKDSDFKSGVTIDGNGIAARIDGGVHAGKMSITGAGNTLTFQNAVINANNLTWGGAGTDETSPNVLTFENCEITNTVGLDQLNDTANFRFVLRDSVYTHNRNTYYAFVGSNVTYVLDNATLSRANQRARPTSVGAHADYENGYNPSYQHVTHNLRIEFRGAAPQYACGSDFSILTTNDNPAVFAFYLPDSETTPGEYAVPPITIEGMWSGDSGFNCPTNALLIEAHLPPSFATTSDKHRKFSTVILKSKNASRSFINGVNPTDEDIAIWRKDIVKRSRAAGLLPSGMDIAVDKSERTISLVYKTPGSIIIIQ